MVYMFQNVAAPFTVGMIRKRHGIKILKLKYTYILWIVSTFSGQVMGGLMWPYFILLIFIEYRGRCFPYPRNDTFKYLIFQLIETSTLVWGHCKTNNSCTFLPNGVVLTRTAVLRLLNRRKYLRKTSPLVSCEFPCTDTARCLFVYLFKDRCWI